MAYIAVTNTFTNGSVADAGAVNTNFTDIINGLSDGTKDLSVAAITAAGTTTLNGAVNLGNATSDDITITGYVASAIVPKTDDTYDLGTAALAWQDLYLEGTCYTDAIAPLGTTIGISASGAVSIGSTAAGVAITTHSTAGDDFTVNTTSLVIEGDTGRIGFGTATPNYRMHAYAVSDAAIVLLGLENHSTNAAAESRLSFITGDAGDEAFISRVINGGSALGGSRSLNVQNGGTNGVYIGAGGNSWTAISDMRYKTKIKDLSAVLDKVNNISSFYYTTNEDLNKRVFIGLSAQEIYPIFPEIVEGTPETKMGINYDRVSVLLVKCVQELSAKLEVALSRIETLENRA
jgi:hypothetical protein